MMGTEATNTDNAVLAKLLGKIAIDDATGCWNWTAHISANGYGKLSVARKCRYAHRVAYQLLIGPIPDGLQIDHLCRNRRCCNPEHLEPVSQRVNIMRGASPTTQNANKTACERGHPFDEKNTYYRGGWRYCRTCHREHQGRRNAANAAAEGRVVLPLTRNRTACPAGHPYSPENTYRTPNGCRRCRECARARGRTRKATLRHRVAAAQQERAAREAAEHEALRGERG